MIITDMNDGKFVSDEIVNQLIKELIFDRKKTNLYLMVIQDLKSG